MILTAIFLLGEKVRWRRGLATAAGLLSAYLVMVRPDGGTSDLGAMVGLIAAFLGALSTTLIKRLSATEEALTILVSFGLFSWMLTAIPACFAWRPLAGDEFARCSLSSALWARSADFARCEAFAAGELMAVAPVDYTRLIFAGIMGFLLFAELPDRYTLVDGRASASCRRWHVLARFRSGGRG